MKLFDTLFKKFGYVKAGRKRDLDAGRVDRTTFDWATTPISMDSNLRNRLRSIRTRSRELADNDSYMQKFLRLLEINVIGEIGIILRNRAKDPNGQLDKRANDLIETEWWNWGKREYCTVNKRTPLVSLEKQIIRTIAKDGEIFLLKVKDVRNPWGFSLRPICAEYVDEELNQDLGSNRQIRMGVELDIVTRERYAYHFKSFNPADTGYMPMPASRYIRIPANDVIHCFLPIDPEQTRGLPWTFASLLMHKMLHGYQEAELIASRISACKFGEYERTKESDPEFSGEQDDNGNFLTDMEPGQIGVAPMGWTLKTHDLQHPNKNYADFEKAMLRGISAACMVSYNSLANDYESVNYSSARIASLDERDCYKMLQNWMAEDCHEEIYKAWLDSALALQKIPLPYRKIDKFNAPSWRGRRWPWVDPEADIKAEQTKLKLGVTSLRRVVDEISGEDLEDVLKEIEEDKQLFQEHGIDYPSFEDKKPAEKPATQNLTVDNGA